ncbi:calcineurin-like phosphoesterase C-terminal domain-containing protein [Cecembia rubra]|uniref:3',5'-cyclic AMP phosphodiesterase CpdA n=1 Tax=Cecembia rubra TaxID=1485585 RepID=A0A2P8E7X5_9BACT|nr:calcineurin-like phosphoesterase family protein [Cecembia rubra]PSL05537.1 3',5'-cyclic AMP phosphodiesterase CpdA [Cecembia rubra]
MKKLQILLIALLFTSIAFAQEKVSGIVYEDSNKNGKKERREKGIPGVAVSNGIQVVLTDDKGKYEIPIAEHQSLFVIKPSDYDLPHYENNIPQFYYIYKPNGSPSGLKYPGVAPTGPLPKSIAFGLYPSEKESSFTALIFGDPQPYNERELEWFYEGIVKEVEGIQDISFGASLGDLVGDRPDFFPAYKDIIGKVGVPWFQVMGNHDMNFDVSTDEFSDESFTASFGPATYAFNHGDAHFIVLENILYPDPRDGQGYWGGLRKDQLAFVENNLKFVPKDKLVVLLMHIPLFEENGDSFRDTDREKLLELISPYANTLSLSAHTHYMKQTFFDKKDGFQGAKPHHHFNIGTPSGDWYSGKILADGTPASTMRDGSPKGYLFLEINGSEYSARYKAAGNSADYQMQIHAPKVLVEGVRTTAQIVANFFTSSPSDKVRYRINEGDWKSMDNLEGTDPSFWLEVMEWDTTENYLPGRRPSNPALTDHLWRASMPSNLSSGEYIIEVEATDMFGNKHTAKHSFQVIKQP